MALGDRLQVCREGAQLPLGHRIRLHMGMFLCFW